MNSEPGCELYGFVPCAECGNLQLQIWINHVDFACEKLVVQGGHFSAAVRHRKSRCPAVFKSPFSVRGLRKEMKAKSKSEKSPTADKARSRLRSLFGLLKPQNLLIEKVYKIKRV